LKDSFGSKVENENPGNVRSFSVQLPVNVADWVGKAALRKDKTPEQFLRELIITSPEEEAMPLTLRLQRLDELVKKMQVTVKKAPMQEEKDAKTHVRSLEERTKRRELGLLREAEKAWKEIAQGKAKKTSKQHFLEELRTW
jgi:hypothetical protein